MRNSKEKLKILLAVSSVLLLAACANGVIQSDWDQLSSSAQDEICYGVEKFGADTAAGLEYTMNSDYSKDDLADFLRGKC